MKHRTHLLLALPLVTATNMRDPRLGRRHCSIFYEHAGISSPTTIDGIEYAGVVEYGGGSSSSAAAHVGVFDTPIYEDANIDNATPIGRIMGSFWPHVSESDVGDEAAAQRALHTGLWNFNFFESEAWISASLGFGPNNSSANTPNVVIGGTGEYTGYIGTVEHNVVNSNPFIIEYTICPPSPFSVMEIKSECIDVFTNDSSQPSIIWNLSFTGDVFRGEDNHVGVLDNPTFKDNPASLNKTSVDGRNIGVYFPNSLQTTTALFNFEFFNESSAASDDDEVDWIVTSFGFSFDSALDNFTSGQQPNVILGGSGKYSGIVGTIEDAVEEFLPTVEGQSDEINYYQICSDDDPFPNPIVVEECTVIYERFMLEPFTVGGFNFSGSILVGEDDHLGIFNNPFFMSSDVENATVAGRIMGHYFVNERGAATGQWNFHFFGGSTDEIQSGWLTGNLGFGVGDFPDVAVGGTGDWKGFQGRIRSTKLSEEIISWTICPEGKGFAGGETTIMPTKQPTTSGNETFTTAPAMDEEDENLSTTSSAARMMKYVPTVMCIAYSVSLFMS